MASFISRARFLGAAALFVLLDRVASWRESGLLARVALGLGVGAAGGLLAHAAGLPLAFMLGALFATMAASLAGLPVAAPARLRVAFLALIGLFLGESFDADTLARMAAWPTTIALALLYAPVASAAAYQLYARAARLDPRTAAFCAIPGGLSGVIFAAAAFGAAEERVALAQSLRVALIVLSAPALFFGILGAPPPEGGHLAAHADLLTLGEAALLVGVSAVAIVLCDRLGLPLSFMIAPMLASAALRLSGVVTGALPVWLVETALVVTGASLGCRFQGADPRALAALAGWTALATLAMTLVSVGFALAAARLVDVSFEAALLAFMPGGVAEMAIIALAIDLDPSFVATHHMARILFILAALPLLAPWLARRLDRRCANAG